MNISFLGLVMTVVYLFILPMLNTLYTFMKGAGDQSERHGLLATGGKVEAIFEFAVITIVMMLWTASTLFYFYMSHLNEVYSINFIMFCMNVISYLIIERFLFFYLHFKMKVPTSVCLYAHFFTIYVMFQSIILIVVNTIGNIIH